MPKQTTRPAKPAAPDTARARAFAIDAARTLVDNKCEHIVVLNVSAISQVTDFIVIASGTSNRQMAAALHHVQEVGEQQGHTCFRTSSDDNSLWLLADFVDVVVHVFEPNTRAHYDLEMLWGDAEKVAWERPRAGKPTKVENPDRA
jgi:ribosome-associated protein